MTIETMIVANGIMAVAQTRRNMDALTANDLKAATGLVAMRVKDKGITSKVTGVVNPATHISRDQGADTRAVAKSPA
jgi:hypothetical protein